MPSNAKIISRACDCSVKLFVQCMFDERYDVLLIDGEATPEQLQDAWRNIYDEYVDLSGSSESEELNLMCVIGMLSCRIKKIHMLLDVQRISLQVFGMPCLPGLPMFKQYGHKIYWITEKPDQEQFERKLLQIENLEKQYEVKFDQKFQELMDLQAKPITDISVKRKRTEFMKLLNYLQKYGFVIDDNTTTVERLAIMIADYSAACQAALLESKKQR